MNFILRLIPAILTMAITLVVAVLSVSVLSVMLIFKASADGKITAAEQEDIATDTFSSVWSILRGIPVLNSIIKID